MKRKIFISVSALLLSVCVALCSVFVGAPDVAQAAATDVYEFEKLGYKNTFDFLLDRDGFIYGMDYNWCLDVEKGAFSMGNNNVLNMDATYTASVVERDFYNIKALGFNCTTWWLMSNLQGMIFSSDGLALGVESTFKTNLRHMLNTAREVNLPVVPALIPHGLASNYGQGNGEENSQDIYNKYFRFIYDDEALDALITNVIEPVCQILSEYPDVIAAVSLNIENSTEWVDDYDKGIFQYGHQGTTFENWAKFVNALHDAVKKYMPKTPTTIEMGGGADLVDWADERMYMQNELKVDLISENYYHSGGGIESVSNGYNTRPGFIGEYNGGESNHDEHSQEYWASIKKKFNRSAKEGGWLGAFYFCYGAGGSAFAITSANNTNDYDSFYYWAVTFGYDIADQIAEFKGTTSDTLEKSTLLYYNGGNNLYWIPARGAQTFTLERSSDGGNTWEVAASNIDFDTYSISNGLIKYEVTNNKDQTNYMFRVKSHSEEGQVSVSEPSNEMLYYIPPELTTNGGFETTNFVSTGEKGWESSESTAKVFSFSTEQVASGEYALKVDTVNNSAGYTTFKQPIETEKDGIYELTYKVYCEDFEYNPQNDYSEPASFSFYDMDTGKTITAVFNKTTDGGWLTGSLLCNVGDIENVGIRFMSGTSNAKYVMYIDDISVKEVR